MGHDGIWTGFRSDMVLAPDEGIGVLVFANTGGFDPRGVSVPLGDALLRLLLALPDDAVSTGIPERPWLWSELCGWYSCGPGVLTDPQPRMLFGRFVIAYPEEEPEKPGGAGDDDAIELHRIWEPRSCRRVWAEPPAAETPMLVGNRPGVECRRRRDPGRRNRPVASGPSPSTSVASWVRGRVRGSSFLADMRHAERQGT